MVALNHSELIMHVVCVIFPRFGTYFKNFLCKFNLLGTAHLSFVIINFRKAFVNSLLGILT